MSNYKKISRNLADLSFEKSIAISCGWISFLLGIERDKKVGILFHISCEIDKFALGMIRPLVDYINRMTP